MNEEWRALGAEAARFLREGRWPEAIAALDQLLKLTPDHADSWFNLGYAQRHARQYRKALESYDKAIVLGLRSPEEAHLNRAVILSEHLHLVDEAKAALELAIAANPNTTAAWLNLGNLHEDLGETEAAAEAYRGALRSDPNNGRAIARIAMLDALAGPPEQAADELRRAAQRVGQGTEDAAEIAFALGNALDAAGDYRAAFAAIREGNAIAQRLRKPETRYDPKAQEALIDALIETFPTPPESSGDRPPVTFICGMFRSGSTLIEQLLGRHPEITAGGELEFVPAMVAERLQPYPASVPALSAEQVRSLRADYLGDIRALFPDARIVTDKRPDNFLHIGLIKTLFPGARIVHTVRDPLDTIVSAYFLYFASSIAYSERLEGLVHYYGQYRRLMAHWRDLHGDDIFDVDYDRLVVEPEAVLRPLLAFLGLDWDDACLDHLSGRPAVRTASVWQVRKPLHAKSSGRWRNYEPELADVQTRLRAMGVLGDPGR